MKKITLIALAALITSCHSTDFQKIEKLEAQIEKQQELLEKMYKPGFGDLMGGLQHHHSKLWFAGINENWELADFAMHELEEIVEDIKTIHGDRDEAEYLFIIEPALDSLDEAVDSQNLDHFKTGYLGLTNACNTCHIATGYEFILIQTPTSPTYTNQDYSKKIRS